MSLCKCIQFNIFIFHNSHIISIRILSKCSLLTFLRANETKFSFLRILFSFSQKQLKSGRRNWRYIFFLSHLFAVFPFLYRHLVSTLWSSTFLLSSNFSQIPYQRSLFSYFFLFPLECLLLYNSVVIGIQYLSLIHIYFLPSFFRMFLSFPAPFLLSSSFRRLKSLLVYIILICILSFLCLCLCFFFS